MESVIDSGEKMLIDGNEINEEEAIEEIEEKSTRRRRGKRARGNSEQEGKRSFEKKFKIIANSIKDSQENRGRSIVTLRGIL